MHFCLARDWPKQDICTTFPGSAAVLRFADSPVVSQCTDRRDTAFRRILVLIFLFFIHGHCIKLKVTNILHVMMLKIDLYHSRALKMRVSNSSIISYTIFMEHCQIRVLFL